MSFLKKANRLSLYCFRTAMESSSSGGAVAEHSRRRIAYYYDANIGNYYYGVEHVMKPNRIRMAHHLILNYGMYRHLGIFVS